MRKKQPKYPIETELEKLIREIRLLVKKFGVFFFEIPKRKDDKMIHIIEVSAWLLLTYALILRAT